MENEHGQQHQEQQFQESVQWRRDKVLELSSQGHSQRDISKVLQVSLGTVNKDLSYLRGQSRQKIRKYIDEVLPNEYEKCLVGITSILKEAWNISNNTEADSKREKIHALSLAKECYSMKLELLTNATVVDDAIRFVSDKSKENLKKSPNKEGRDSNEQQSKEESKNEPDYDEDSELEEETEIMKEPITTTTNQVF
jgi:hypothetical protein